MSVGMPDDSPRKPCALMTLKDLDDAGRDVRAWCFECQRGEVIDTMIWKKFEARGWSIALGEAAARFRCQTCGSSDAVRLYPAWREPVPPNAGARLVERFFHGMRAQKDQGLGRFGADLAAQIDRQREHTAAAAAGKEARAVKAEELRAGLYLVPKRADPRRP